MQARTFPMMPYAVRGTISEQPVKETSEQLEAGLVWWPCGFCNLRVLISADRHTHERCSCGAVRLSHYDSVGWRLGDVEWWSV